VLQRLDGLRIGVAHTDDLSVRSGGRSTRDENLVADLYSARVAHDRLPLSTTGDVLSFHESHSSIADIVSGYRNPFGSRRRRLPITVAKKPSPTRDLLIRAERPRKRLTKVTCRRK